MIDSFGRNIDYMRVSLTDKCNLNCIYCRSDCDKSYLDTMSADEIIRIINIVTDIGIKKIKLTGGEPLLRKDFEYILENISKIPEIEDITLTTNGIYLKKYAHILKKYNVKSINVSLDTLDKNAYKKITGYDYVESVKSSINYAIKLGFNVKINSVVIKDFNENIFELAEIAKHNKISVRFIELMPMGEGRKYKYIQGSEVIKRLEEKYGKFEKTGYRSNGPCVYYKNNSFKGTVGLITAVSDCFCSQCNRIRMTSDGFIKLCLYYNKGINIKEMIDSGATDNEIKNAIKHIISQKPESHHFGIIDENSENKNMVQIGG
jgi:cyclic pyranopterin phosphate synthase